MPLAPLGWAAAAGLASVLVHQIRQTTDEASRTLLLALVVLLAWQTIR